MQNDNINFPSCQEIEDRILSSLFFSREIALKYFPLLESEYFYQTVNKKIYDKMKIMLSNDASIIMEALPDSIDAITAILDHASSTNLDEYIKILKDRYYRRGMIETAIKIINNCENNFDQSAQMISENGISEMILRDNSASPPETIGQIFPRLIDNLQKATTGEGMKTGFHDVDDITGIIQPSEYIILAGRPSMGKTAFGICMARKLSKMGYPVLIFSIETTKEVMCGRVVFGETNCSYDKILRGNQIELKKATDNSASIIQEPIYIDDTPSITIGHMEAIAETYVKNYGVKIIMVDHVGLIKGMRERSRHEELSNISKGIKFLLKKLNVPGIIICQLSREVEKRSPPIPILSDLRESGSLEEDSDKVIFIYREEYYKRETEKKGIAEIIIAKNKNGRTGYQEIQFDKETMNFNDLLKGQFGEDEEPYYKK